MSNDRATDRERLITRPFVLVTLSTLALFLYVGIMVPVVPRFVEDELGGGGTEIGWTVAVFAVAAILVRPVIGRVGDRRGRRVLMVVGASLTAVSAVLSGFAPSLLVLLLLRALAGIGEAALFVGGATLIADLAPSERRAEAASYFSVAVFLGIGIGPIVGEAVLSGDRFVLAMAAGGVFAAISAVIALFVPDRVAGVAQADADAPTRLFHRAALMPGLILMLGTGGFAAFNAFMTLHTDDLGMPGASTVFVVYSVVALVVRVFGARLPERLGLARAGTASLVSLTLGLVLISTIDATSGLYVGTAVVALGMALLYPSLMALVVNRVDDTERASAMSTFTMFFELGTVAGGLLLGPVAEAGGAQAAFLGGAVFAVAGLAMLRGVLLPRLGGRAVAPAPAPAPALAVEPAACD